MQALDTPVDHLLYSRLQSARILGISVRKLDQLVAEKVVVPRRIGRRVLFPRAELERFARVKI